LTGGPAAEDSAPAQTLSPASFEELRVIWNRGFIENEDADRRAFARARQHAADDEIIAGAHVWRNAQTHPRYLPKLADWLDQKGYSKPPPVKQPAQGRAPHRRNGHKVDLARLTLLQGGYVETADGRLVWGGDE
jgi:hypothetical protein